MANLRRLSHDLKVAGGILHRGTLPALPLLRFALRHALPLGEDIFSCQLFEVVLHLGLFSIVGNAGSSSSALSLVSLCRPGRLRLLGGRNSCLPFKPEALYEDAANLLAIDPKLARR